MYRPTPMRACTSGRSPVRPRSAGLAGRRLSSGEFVPGLSWLNTPTVDGSLAARRDAPEQPGISTVTDNSRIKIGSDPISIAIHAEP